MSSDVQEKCINSLYFARWGYRSNFSLRKYSIALTSWLVVASMVLILSASSIEKLWKIESKNCYCSMIICISFSLWVVICSWNKSLNHSNSTNTLYLIKANSEKYCLRSCDYRAYLPSIGDIAVRVLTLVIFVENMGWDLMKICGWDYAINLNWQGLEDYLNKVESNALDCCILISFCIFTLIYIII